MGKTLRLGAGSGFSGDRIEPAVDLARDGGLDYLVFECLAERTIAIAQLAKLDNPDAGFDPLIERRFRAALPFCARQGVKIVTNMGAANPLAAARRVAVLCRELGYADQRVAAVTGDDVLDILLNEDSEIVETGLRASDMRDTLVSANAYLGARPIAAALDAGATIVVTGRVSDPALFLGPLLREFGWRDDDWNMLGRGVMAGHLLECAGQITGGYFADPGVKDVADLARLGFPIGIVDERGEVEITKLAGSGGAVTTATCKEQLLYEIGDPAAYMQPDVIADFSCVRVTEIGKDRVRATGAGGHAAPSTLKCSVGYRDGFVGEGQMSYAGPGALSRARLAGEIVRERLSIVGVAVRELRIDVIGADSLHGAATPQTNSEPYEARLRVAARTDARETAQMIGEEVESLYTNGPAGGGGAWKGVKPVIAIASAYIAREKVRPIVTFVEAQ
ncbi:MAG: acyclic terpene utilization AtuA family protein [Rhodoblastus sp.]